MLNVLTVDIEDWQQSTLDNNLPISPKVYKNAHRFLDILKKRKVKATLFFQGMVAEKYPELVERAVKEGHEIATHGYAHKVIFKQDKEEFENDLKKSIDILEDIAQIKIRGYRAPDYSVTKDSLWALNILSKNGIQYDSSIFPIKNPRYGIPDFHRFPICIENDGGNPLWEIPLSTLNYFGFNIPFAGGGYFRLYPYELTRWGIKQLNKQGQPTILYFHPYELDTNEFQEIKERIPWRLRLTQGLNRKKTEKKLEKLFDDFEFCTISEYVNKYLEPHGK